MVELLDTEFVVHWANVRRDPVPDFRSREQVLLGAELDEDGRFRDPFAQTPHRDRRAGPGATDVCSHPQQATKEESVEGYWSEGHLAYSRLEADDVLEMLEAALDAR